MSSDGVQNWPAFTENISSGEVEAESNNIDSLEAVYSGRESMHELERAEDTLLRVELDIACSTEKLVNLGILVMHVASRENDFEAFASEEEHTLGDSIVKAFEYDLLFGFLDSEVREMESFLSDIQTDIVNSRKLVSSAMHLGDIYMDMEDMLQDCEDSLKQSFEQMSDIKMQSANFRRILLASSGDEKWKDGKELDASENPSDLSAKIKMQTAEQQKNILRMLEKSLARELDLEKRLTESKEAEEDLNFRLQQEIFCMEQEAEDMWERLFEAENNAEIFFGVSKELFGQIQMAQQNNELKEKAPEAEKRANIAEAECKLLRQSNTDLNTDLSHLKSTITDAINRVEQLEKQLKESEIKQLHAVATAEASQEKQSMLDSTIKDMENLIKDLKSNVLRAELQVESAEDKCIILSESNAELIEEINYLRRRMKCFETSLHQADEAKKQTAKDIRLVTKLIADLVLQLALERERLHKQISSLAKEKNVAVKYLGRKKDPSVNVMGSHAAKVMHSENDNKNGSPGKESDEDIMVSSATSSEMANTRGDSSTTGRADDADTVRNIDARQLECKEGLPCPTIGRFGSFVSKDTLTE